MIQVKVHILYGIVSEASGGGNQFLGALRKYCRSRSCYADDPADADVVLFNSHHFIDKVLRAKRRFPAKIFVHRIDGPMKLYNIKSDMRDDITNIANRVLADATIFQSDWSRENNYALGLLKKENETVIVNAPDPEIFNRSGRKGIAPGPVRLIATSWSDNMKKGFEVYRWLDENLDFERYRMSFVGNSPLEFKNINHVRPVKSLELAGLLKEHAIFITGSQKDPCSNSLIEAMHCGLPAVALHDGGHPEIVGQGGELFQRVEEIPLLLDRIVREYSRYENAINLPRIDEVGHGYLDFIRNLMERVRQGRLRPGRLSFWEGLRVRFELLRWKYGLLFSR